MSLRNDTWLIQRLNKPKGYKNPWGNVNNEAKDVNISEVIDVATSNISKINGV